MKVTFPGRTAPGSQSQLRNRSLHKVSEQNGISSFLEGGRLLEFSLYERFRERAWTLAEQRIRPLCQVMGGGGCKDSSWPRFDLGWCVPR